MAGFGLLTSWATPNRGDGEAAVLDCPLVGPPEPGWPDALGALVSDVVGDRNNEFRDCDLNLLLPSMQTWGLIHSSVAVCGNLGNLVRPL